MFNITEELKKLPELPGVYIMKDKTGKVIYVGKSKCLKNRVRSYFQTHSADYPKNRAMTPLIASFEYIVTDNEAEALILENNLIKKYWPRFNARLRDDRTYPFIKLTANEEYPRVMMVYKHKDDGAKYYGPYPSGSAIIELLALIKQIWPLRSCSRTDFWKNPKTSAAGRACLNYHIGECDAPCEGKVSKEDYTARVAELTDFLDGKHGDLLKKLETDMDDCAEKLEFEKAALLRDQIHRVRQFVGRQKLDNTSGDSRDAVAFAKDGDEALAQLFLMRGGKMLGREHFMMTGVKDMDDGEIMSAFIMQFYSGNPDIPPEIVVQSDFPEIAEVAELLSKERGGKVSVSVPKRGEKLKLIEMAKRNAKISLERYGSAENRGGGTTAAITDLAKTLGEYGIDEDALKRIEAYDISNTQGFESVGSMVVFENGKPKRRDYRKFKIKTVEGADDYASLTEVLTRRFARLADADNNNDEKSQKADVSFSQTPGVLLIDGGKGQVSAAEAVLKDYGLEIPVLGMVKDDKHRTRGIMRGDTEIEPKRSSEAFKLLTRIQDETHRFAVEYHRKLREKKMVRSELDGIKGVGETRKKALMSHFGTINEIKKADVEDLLGAPGLSRPAAQAVYDYFHA